LDPKRHEDPENRQVRPGHSAPCHPMIQKIQQAPGDHEGPGARATRVNHSGPDLHEIQVVQPPRAVPVHRVHQENRELRWQTPAAREDPLDLESRVRRENQPDRARPFVPGMKIRVVR